MRSTTIRDVARHAGVSIATVSRVMRDSQTVRPDTRDRVLAAADELEYTPSQLGRQLAERRHAANGIVFPDLSGPYYAEVVLGYEAVAAELRRSVLILSTHGRTDAEAAVREMAGRCDGLVILGRTVSDAVIESLADRGSRLVLVARPGDTEDPQTSVLQVCDGGAVKTGQPGADQGELSEPCGRSGQQLGQIRAAPDQLEA